VGGRLENGPERFDQGLGKFESGWSVGVLDRTVDIDGVLDDEMDVVLPRVAVSTVTGILDSVPGPRREVHPSWTNFGRVLRHPLLGPIEYHFSLFRFGRLSYDNVSCLGHDRQAENDGTDTGTSVQARSEQSASCVDMEGLGSLRDLRTVPGSDGTYSQSCVTCVEGEFALLFQLFFDHCSDSTGRDQVGFQSELIGLHVSVRQCARDMLLTFISRYALSFWDASPRAILIGGKFTISFQTRGVRRRKP
jgi:hypothetical protein